ncbi:MAG: formylglycine-generating enzyme family protein, partial [Deltaproteobacteria bacterium]|nr:formylglycine-generating enzyme family protein [Deltaproteobacteria bacterium]
MEMQSWIAATIALAGLSSAFPNPAASRSQSMHLAWAEVLEQKPDAAVVTDAKLRGEIERTGLPWRVKDKGTGIELLLVPPGKYRRGVSPGDTRADDDEGPAHDVTITQAFYLGRYEVTQAEWQGAMGPTPSGRFIHRQAPVEVSYEDIEKFNQRTRLRLPTEAEWEFASRAGTAGPRHAELDAACWFSGNSGSTTHITGTKRANALGFHDMLGNVWEWCSDWYSADEYGRCSAGVVDPTGPATGSVRVLRGGSWHDNDWGCRASDRNNSRPSARVDDRGFRVSRNPELSLAVAPPSPDERLPWADVLEVRPDAAVVTDAKLRGEIERTGLPWRVKDKGTGIELLLVPPGKYRRGASPGDDDADDDESPIHDVRLTQPFYLGRYEVTQAQWQAAMGSNPYKKSGDPRAPVDSVGGYDDYGLQNIEAINPAYDEGPPKDIASFNQKTGLRLPTEAEWEYACRAGSTAGRYGELDDVAWYRGNSGSTTHPVGQKRANALGFHDMLGNVWEWCSDRYSYSEYDRCSSGVVDPKGPSTKEARVLRGGSWGDDDRDCRASGRAPGGPASRLGINCGFRASRTLGFSVPISPLPSSSESAPPTKSAATPDARLPWAEVLEQKPDAAVVTDAKLRGEIEQTGLPWRVK